MHGVSGSVPPSEVLVTFLRIIPSQLCSLLRNLNKQCMCQNNTIPQCIVANSKTYKMSRNLKTVVKNNSVLCLFMLIRSLHCKQGNSLGFITEPMSTSASIYVAFLHRCSPSYYMFCHLHLCVRVCSLVMLANFTASFQLQAAIMICLLRLLRPEM